MNFLALFLLFACLTNTSFSTENNERIFKTIHENFKAYESEMSELEIDDGGKIKSATFYFQRNKKQLNFYLNFKKPESLADTKLWLQLSKESRKLWIQIKDGKIREIKADTSGNIKILGTEFDVSDLALDMLDYEKLKNQSPKEHNNSISFNIDEKTQIFLQKENYRPIKISKQESNKEIKSILMEDFQNYDGIFLPNIIQAINHVNQKTSQLLFKNRFVNIQLSQELFKDLP